MSGLAHLLVARGIGKPVSTEAWAGGGRQPSGRVSSNVDNRDRGRDPSASGTPGRGRRPRYPGTHPRRFDERYKEKDPQRFPEMQEHIRAQGRTPAGTHVPVLQDEVLARLGLAAGDTVADVTLGAGGHAAAMMKAIGPEGRFFGLDRDGCALAAARSRLEGLGPSATFLSATFSRLPEILAAEGCTGCDAILADLGVSSMQIDDPARGFSFKQDGPLDMRMDQGAGEPAAELLTRLSIRDLSEMFKDLADEPEHEAVALAIGRRRKRGPITSTLELAEIVLEAKGLDRTAWKERTRAHPGLLHPAAQVFQALRMVVNDELAELRRFLESATSCLRPGGRLVIISFHRGEDRLVKQAFKAGLVTGILAAVAEDPVRPAQGEVAANPRSSAAKLRWARRAAAETGRSPGGA